MTLPRLNIVVKLPDKPQVWEQKAAAELRDYLKKTCLSVTAHGMTAVFHVGDTETALSSGYSSTTMADEEWVVKTLPDASIIFCGGGTRGTLYSVFCFLENHVGVRWFSPTEEFLPEARHLDLSGMHLSGRPFFRIRNVYRRPKAAFDRGRFAARNRLNQDGEWPLIDPAYGSCIDFGSPTHCHTMQHGYLPAEKYFRKHPEYYALIDGKRNPDMYFGQFCLSHANLPEMLIGKLKAYILADEKKAARSGRVPPRIYDISLNDSRSFCQCPECAEKVARYGESGTLLLLLNQIAGMLKEFRPGYFLQTLAYFATTAPPRGGIKPLDNIIIRTCNTETYLHQSLLSPLNQKFRRQVEDWAEHADMLFPWEYSITYGGAGPLPYPSEYTLAENVRFYAANKGIGIFFEHENPQLNDMYDLKVFMEAKLMENPKLDSNVLMSDFCTKYYGQGAAAILEYRRFLRITASENQAQVHYFFPAAQDFRYIDWPAMKKMQEILDAGQKKVVRNPILLHRFNRARASLDFALVCSLSWWYRNQAEKCGEETFFKKRFAASRRRLFPCWRKSIIDLQTVEKRALSQGQLDLLEVWEKRSSLAMISRKDLCKGQLEFFTPDCWRIIGSAACLRSPKASAGAFYRFFPELHSSEKICLAVSQYNVSTQADPVLCSVEYSGEDIEAAEFVWLPVGRFELAHDDLVLSILSRHRINWRFDFLLDQYRGREVRLWVEMRYRGGAKPCLDIGSVLVTDANQNGKPVATPARLHAEIQITESL